MKQKIDVNQVASLAERFWSIQEIAAFFSVETEWLENKFGKVIEEAQARGRGNIRDLQWKSAMRGRIQAILHLSKHYLNQHDLRKVKIENLTDQELEQLVRDRLAQKPSPPLLIDSGESKGDNDEEGN